MIGNEEARLTALRRNIKRAAKAKAGIDADGSIGALIESRHRALARAVADVDETDPSWKKPVERFDRAAEAERLQAWREYHEGLCGLHRRPADEHEAAARLANLRGEAGSS